MLLPLPLHYFQTIHGISFYEANYFRNAGLLHVWTHIKTISQVCSDIGTYMLVKVYHQLTIQVGGKSGIHVSYQISIKMLCNM